MLHGPLNGEMADFTYDCRNRLIKVKEGDGTVTAYEYDAENVRTAKATGGIRTEYTTDREAEYSQTLVKTDYEKNAFGQYTKECGETLYTYGLGLSSEKRKDGDVYYYHYNNLGSTTAVTDENGKIVYRFFYGTYGELSDMTNAEGASLKYSEAVKEETAGCTLSELASAAGMEYLYNGQYGVSTDKNSLYYMRARYYDQDIRRFINRDVISGEITNSQSLNRYAYVQGSPVSLTDPFGLCPDSNSAFKNLCINLYHTDWNAVGHAALDVAGIFFEGADVVNAIWYACEGNMEQAAASALCALPGAGLAAGSLLMKSSKLAPAGRVVKAIAKLTQGGMGLYAGISTAQTGFTNLLNGLEAGTFDAGAFWQTIGGIGIAVLSGKGMVSSGRDLLVCTGNAGKTLKGRLLDADISGMPVENESTSSLLLRAERARDDLIINTPGGMRKSMAIGAYDVKTGEVVADFAGPIPEKISPVLIERAERIGGIGSTGLTDRNTIGVCAEFRSANRLLLNGSDINNVRFTKPVRPRTGKVRPNCRNCIEMFSDIL